MSSKSRNGYFASYEPELDIMMLGVVHECQADTYIGDDAGFDWGVDKTSDGRYEYVDTEIDGWVDREGAKYDAQQLIRFIADKADWDYSSLRDLVAEVMKEDGVLKYAA